MLEVPPFKITTNISSSGRKHALNFIKIFKQKVIKIENKRRKTIQKRMRKKKTVEEMPQRKVLSRKKWKTEKRNNLN